MNFHVFAQVQHTSVKTWHTHLLKCKNKIQMIGIRDLKLRPLPGWYVTLSLQDASVPEFTPDLPTLENTIGIDMGLDSFLVTDEGESISVKLRKCPLQESLLAKRGVSHEARPHPVG